MSTAKSVDLTYLKQIRALARPGAPDILKTVSGVFLTQSPTILAAITESLSAGDFRRAAQLAHKLKSTSGNLGARPLFERLDRFETLEESRPLQDRLALFAEIQEECARVRVILETGMAHGFDTLVS